MTSSPGDHVHVSQTGTLPMGAMVIDVMGDHLWLDVCILGQHLPQMYRPAEVQPLDAKGCPDLGLCPDCVGYGITDPLDQPEFSPGYPYAVDQVPSRCATCEGSGRPYLRAGVTRSPGTTTGTLTILPHPMVMGPGPECLGCGGMQTDPPHQATLPV